MEYKLKLDSFEGPLELLYQLVKKNKIDISEISLAKIADQYLKQLDKLDKDNLEFASEFLVIAAELIQIKVRMLLPTQKAEVEDESNLVHRLHEYELFKNIAKILKEYENEAQNYFPVEVSVEDVLNEELEIDLSISSEELYQAVLVAIQSEKEEKNKVIKNPVLDYIKEEKINIEDKIEDIISIIKKNNYQVGFINLIKDRSNKMEIVVTLLSLLELMKLKQVRVTQNNPFSEINVGLEG